MLKFMSEQITVLFYFGNIMTGINKLLAVIDRSHICMCEHAYPSVRPVINYIYNMFLIIDYDTGVVSRQRK